MTNKTLVIGLDGATFDVLGPLVDRGQLPHLAALMAQGAWGRLASTVPPFTAAAWSTLITGQNPGQHGIITFETRDRYNYDTTGSGFVSAQRFRHTLWERLGEAGRSVGVVNVPLTYPAREVNGFMVTGMLTPPGAPYTYPPDLPDRLSPDYVIDLDFIRSEEGFRHQGLPAKEEMLAQIRHMTRTRAENCLQLMGAEAWDFFMVVFTGTDRLFHFFWDELMDLVNERDGALQPELLAYLQELDSAVGRLVAQAGLLTLTFMISDHGFGPAPTRRFYAGVWLERLGMLQRRGASGILDLEYLRVQIGRRKRLKAALRKVIPQATQDSAKSAAEATSGQIIDWSKSQAYFTPIYFHVCGIEINVQGQRREGIVPPGAKYEALRDKIINEARQIKNPETGLSVVEIAARREEIFGGQHVVDFPDVILVLDPDYIPAGSLAGASLFEPHPHPIRPGEHRQDGVFVAAGPSIKPQVRLPDLRLIDVPATVFYSLGLPVPSDYEGRVLTELFEAGHLDRHPLQVQQVADDAVSAAGDNSDYTEEQLALLEERLRALGYVD